MPPVSKCPPAAGAEAWLLAAGAATSSSCLRRGWCVVSTSRRASVTWVLPAAPSAVASPAPYSWIRPGLPSAPGPPRCPLPCMLKARPALGLGTPSPGPRHLRGWSTPEAASQKPPGKVVPEGQRAGRALATCRSHGTWALVQKERSWTSGHGALPLPRDSSLRMAVTLKG